MMPVDEAGKDAGLASLLNRMREFTATRDLAGLESLMQSTFRVEFDAGKGVRAFRSYWRPDRADSPVWEVLSRLLAIGGTFYSASLFAIPYVYTNFPIELSPLSYVVALGDKVGLLARPERGAATAGVLEHSIVPLARPLNPPVMLQAGQFLAVDHPQSGRCYVAAEDVYSPAAHRAFFEKRSNKWRWISLAAATLADPPELMRQGK